MGYQVHVWRQHFVLKCFLWWRMSGSLTDVRGTKMNRACFLYYEPDTTHCLVRVKNYWRNLESLTSLGPLYGTAVLRHPSLFWGWSLCRQSLQSCLTLCKPMDCSPPGSSIHGVFPARILKRAAISSSRGSSQPREGNCISHCRQILSAEPSGKHKLLRKVWARQFHPPFSSSVFLLLHLHWLDRLLQASLSVIWFHLL